MKTFEEFIEEYKIVIPEQFKKNFELIYFAMKVSVQEDINNVIFAEQMEFAKLAKLRKELKINGESK